ncbi:hypothetical protein [Photobacterium leiognathi]|uniref:hypothetical protein n=1 Tax=Photobacterium leiognathi TaxID=553611 RepID=UPI0029825159|nr:hypothetical protein [Photobacterium leiognathi]
MNNRFNQEYVQWSIITLTVFIFLQCALSFSNTGDFLSEFGGMHFFGLVLYFLVIYLCLISDIKVAFLQIALYQVSLTLLLFTYYSYIGSPLGIGLADAMFYDKLALEASQLDTYDSIVNLLSSHDIGDLGFTQFTRVVYMLPGYSVLNMKIINVVLNLSSGLLLYKTAILIGFEREKAKIIIIFFCLNPASLYFNSSGLKEPLFQFVVMVSLFLCYKIAVARTIFYFVITFISVLCTAFFRVPYPIFFLLSFCVYYYYSARGKYKKIAKIVVILLLPLLFSVLWLLIESTMQQWLSLDLGKLQAHRLGRESVGDFEYILLAVVGLIGPIPSFNYDLKHSTSLLLTLPNYVKMCLSGYFLISIYEVIKYKIFEWYPLIIIFFINFLMLVMSASTFDIRYIYPIMPIFYLLVGRKIINGFELKSPISFIYIILFSSLIILYNLR